MAATLDDDPSVIKPPKVGSKRICACGHAEARHIIMPGRGQMCDALKGNCPCRNMDLVLEVSDARVFMRSSEADVHPLIAGMLILRERGGTWDWVAGRDTCDVGRCEGEVKAAMYVNDGASTELRCKEHAE